MKREELAENPPIKVRTSHGLKILQEIFFRYWKIKEIHRLTPLKKHTIKPQFTKTEASLPTKYGNFFIRIYKEDTGDEHTALIKNLNLQEPVLVRIHSSCRTGDVFGSLRCDCGPQLDHAMKLIEKNGSGVLLYLNQEGRGIGLFNKIKAYALQDEGLDTVQANERLGFAPDPRDYHIAAAILEDLKISEIDLLTNNPNKEKQLAEFGIQVIQRIPLEIPPNEFDKKYLLTKKEKLHHKLTLV
jgi:3,4-dihydroxy 2-butanone 4-phosphate synthase / GTP cyclohydrolase II